MKKLLNFSLIILTMVAIVWGYKYHLETSSSLANQNTVVFYNWGDYIDPEVMKQFEGESGYRVIYETFDSNEAMLSKIEQGGTKYDLIVPSEYMIENMISKDMLLPLDKRKLPNLKHVDPEYMDWSFDPGNKYSIPYFWGTLGIVYNERVLGENAIQSWKDLWKPEFRNGILMIDGAREVIGIGLQAQGYDLNETDSKILRKSADLMKTLMPNISALIADEIKMHLVNEENYIGVTYSGEAAMAMWENEDLTYYVPEEGSNFWEDTLAIPKNANNIEGAYALMDFLCRPEIAAANAEYVGYSIPNKSAMALMPEEMIADKAFYPDQSLIDKLSVYRNLGKEKLIEYNDLYLEVKIEPRD
ncbi:ABC transporter substrate-binding protein [Ignavigranum ruoffiae]|uniref:ABC transporter substrate-binding protein n=1 Tax=Ignavigranum ruoffiae TaxID=89093 RepID=UPI003B00FF39